MTPPRKGGLSTETMNQGKGVLGGYEPRKRGKPNNPLTKMTFKIPRGVHHKLLAIADAKGTSQQELLTQALFEWLQNHGEADAALLLAEAARKGETKP